MCGSVDFGTCYIGETVSKSIPLECKVPIQFGFEVKVIEPHPDFALSTLKGVIPASGAAELVVTFRPASLCVSTMEVEVNVSQFNFKPVRCVFVGSASAGMVRERELKTAAAKMATVLPGDVVAATPVKVFEVRVCDGWLCVVGGRFPDA